MDDRQFWAAFRRGLLLVVVAIEKRFDLAPYCPECRERDKLAERRRVTDPPTNGVTNRVSTKVGG